MYSSSPLAFHIICDQAAQEYLEKRLALLKHPQHDILVRFYRIPQEEMERRIQREGALHTDHSAGVRELVYHRLRLCMRSCAVLRSWSHEALHPRDSTSDCRACHLH